MFATLTNLHTNRSLCSLNASYTHLTKTTIKKKGGGVFWDLMFFSSKIRFKLKKGGKGMVRYRFNIILDFKGYFVRL